MKTPETLLFCFYFLCSGGFVIGQSLDINLSHSCLYSVETFEDPLYSFGEEARVVSMVAEICAVTGVEQNFKVLSATVPTVAAVRDSTGNYLLYSPLYAQTLLTENPRLLYIALAHEIGHFARNHRLDGQFRLKEETAADEFMGRALFHLSAFSSLSFSLGIMKEESFAYHHLFAPRKRADFISNGWLAAEGVVRSNANLGYLDSQENQDALPIPAFKLHGCPRPFHFPQEVIANCATLADVDRLLQRAMQELGYDRHGYFHVPNGFAILTPIEQIEANGSALEGQDRWEDYPVGTDYRGILDYLSSLLKPREGYFRLFVFVVSDRNVPRVAEKMESGKAKVWLNSGGDRLPAQIGDQLVSPQHQASVFIYEFTATKAIKKIEEQCDNLFTVADHLAKSGLERALNNNKR
jgi:hypothetical protein